MPSIYEGGGSGRFFYSGVEWQSLDDLFDLLLNELQLLAGALAVEHSVAHRDSDAVHVLDLGDDLFGGAAKPDVAPLVGQGAMAAALQVLGGKLAGHLHRFGDRPTGNRSMVGNAHLITGRIAEPQSADVFDAVIGETKRDLVFLAVDRDGADRVLCYAGV